MKQFLESCGRHLVVSLNDRAFVLLALSNNDDSNISTNTEVNDETKNSIESSSSSCRLIELLSPSSVSLAGGDGGGDGGNGGDDGGDGNLTPAEEQPNDEATKKKKKKKKKTSNEDKDSPNKNAVQAVAAMEYDPNHHNNNDSSENGDDKNNDGLVLLCAVSRHDKSLSIYSIDLRTNNSTTSSSSTSVLNYVLGKRSCSLAWTIVQGRPVVITADLAGDAFAYPAPWSSSWSSSWSVDNTPSSLVPRKKRLLLGHTASMLTSVKIVVADFVAKGESSSSSSSSPSRHEPPRLMLTADRDEKIRLSAFPRTHLVRGYLLGHTAFVSSLDISSSDSDHQQQQHYYCVSASGDGTVRLWNYRTRTLLGCLEAVPDDNDNKNNNTNDDDDDDDDDNSEEKKQSSSSVQNKVDSLVVIPTAVRIVQTLHLDKNTVVVLVAVVRDGSTKVQIVKFEHDTTDDRGEDKDNDDENNNNSNPNTFTTTTTLQEIQCTAQPLALCTTPPNDGSGGNSLYILTSDPNALLLHYSFETKEDRHNNNHHSSSSKTSTSTPLLLSRTTTSLACQTLTQWLVDGHVTTTTAAAPPLRMPTTVLERDESTGQLTMLKGRDVLALGSNNHSDNHSNNNNNSTSTSTNKPWNRHERKQKDRSKLARRKKRLRDEQRQRQGTSNDDDDDDDNDVHDSDTKKSKQ